MITALEIVGALLGLYVMFYLTVAGLARMSRPRK
jgi:hypothetical protein